MERTRSIGIIGLGLMGSSLALKLRECGYASTIIGTDYSELVIQEALSLSIIDSTSSLDKLIEQVELIVIAIPVDAIKNLLPQVLDQISSNQVVMDMGSTKSGIAKQVYNHKNRANYVACHPIAGTENNGPSAAFPSLFENKVNIICDKDSSSSSSVDEVLHITALLGMRPKYMTSKEHDLHIAYVSHLSHISSFTLGQTVLEVENDEENIFDMAGSGFESTVRLAKSSPAMWAPIFTENSENIIEVLSAYIDNLEKYKLMIEQKNNKALQEAMGQTNRIRKILQSKSQLTNNSITINK